MKTGYFLLLAALFLPLSGCKGVGIFATVAISEKIKDGNLPKGINTSNVFNIESGTGFDIISSGSRLWTRSAGNDRGKALSWDSHSLPDGYTNVQSVAVSKDFLLLALANTKKSSYEVALYILKKSSDDKLKSEDFLKIEGANWPKKSNSYLTVSIWCPDPTGSANEFYINIRTFNGKFNDSSSTLQGSNLHKYNVKTIPATWAVGGKRIEAFVPALLTGKRIVTGVAQLIDPSQNPIRRGVLRITARKADNSGGLLLDGQGRTIDYGSSLAVGNITWMWTKKIFIMGSTEKNSSGKYILYMNDPKSNVWIPLSSSSRAASFIDVSHTVAGGDRILIGIDALSGDSGYREIDISNPLLEEWTLDSNTVASKTNYTSSRLSDVSVTAFSFPENKGLWQGRFLYASTRSEGLWKIDLSKTKPDWTRE